MENWLKTCCVLCTQNCGLEALVENGKMVKVRGDKDNPRSLGYICRKGMNVMTHQYPKDRITEPLKRKGNDFIPVTWDEAAGDIAERIKSVLKSYGPRSLAYMGGAAQAGHGETAFGLQLLRSLGSQYYYSPGGQEFSGQWWVQGRVFGKQYNITGPDEHNTDMLVAWGWNGMQSHQIPRARVTLREFSNDKNRLLVVIDPRKNETAAIADIHLAVRPGTDALLIKAMISIIIREGWEKRDYINEHVTGWEKILPFFNNFDVKNALKVCELEYEEVHNLCRLMSTRQWSFHPDLGIYMGRKSVLNSYLLHILGSLCGRFCVPGGNIIPGFVMPLGFHADERKPEIWKTTATNMPPAAAGSYPPSVVPEEILSDNPERLRAMIVSACNPLRAFPDTTAYEEAFSRLDLLVVNEIVMSETARLAHYVLPCKTYFESWESTFYPYNYPEIYYHIRKPVVEPPEQCLEAAEIHTLIADKLGLIPEIPAELYEAAKGNRLAFIMKLMGWIKDNPEAAKQRPFILAKTLGRAMGSANLSAFWAILASAPKELRENAERAGFAKGPDIGERIFQTLLDNPQGVMIGRVDTEKNFKNIKTESGKIELYIPELEEELKLLNPSTEEIELKMPEGFPFILNAGRHMDYNANSLMRDQEWNRGKRACTVAISPIDAEHLGLSDGENVRVTTEAGSDTGELEVSGQVRKGTVLIPHGFGLLYGDVVYGINVNRLTKSTNRDMVGTPIHRFVPCSVERA